MDARIRSDSFQLTSYISFPCTKSPAPAPTHPSVLDPVGNSIELGPPPKWKDAKRGNARRAILIIATVQRDTEKKETERDSTFLLLFLRSPMQLLCIVSTRVSRTRAIPGTCATHPTSPRAKGHEELSVDDATSNTRPGALVSQPRFTQSRHTVVTPSYLRSPEYFALMLMFAGAYRPI